MNMLTLLVIPSIIEEVRQLISGQFRLNEVVSVVSTEALDQEIEGEVLFVKEEGIRPAIPWSNDTPPYLFPDPIKFASDTFLAMVYCRLNNYEQAYAYTQDNPALLTEIDTLNCIQHGVALALPEIPEAFESPYEEYRFWHNIAIIAHYAEITRFVHFSVIRRYYERAFDLAPNDELKAFTGKHWATLLLDAEELITADRLLTDCIAIALSEEARLELMSVQYGVWLKKISAPYDPVLLEKLKNHLWEVLQHYERKQNKTQIALLLIDASQVANFSDSFSESLGYINRAIQLLEEERLTELVASAQYRKGTLLFTWAQNGNPQFYRPAMDAYQQAIRVFTKEKAPETFAEIQHYLGVIYSEVPDEVKKKSVWAAVSVSAFKEALSYFTREAFPYEYARICNNYANALTKYPEAKLTDNYSKALDFYREVLEIRTAEEYPYERALTLLNFLEAAWQVSVPENKQQQRLFTEMKTRAEEANQLVDDPQLVQEVQKHLAALEQLEKVI